MEDAIFEGKCTDCGHFGDVDVDAGMCDICAKKYAEEQAENEEER